MAQYTPDEISDIVTRYNEELIATGKVSRELQQEFENAKKGVKNYAQNLESSLKQLRGSLADTAGALYKGQQGASVFNSSVTSTADAIANLASRFGILGNVVGVLIKALGGYVVAVNEQTDALLKSYKGLTRFGAVAEDGMTGVMNFNQQLGYGVEELDKLQDLVSKNSQSFSILGGTVEDGAKRFGAVAQGIQRSRLVDNFLKMGMSVNDINTGIASYTKLQAQSGSAQRKTTEELTRGTVEYLEQQDRLTKLTGTSADALAQQEQERMADQQFRVVQRELEKKALAGDQQAAQKLNELRSVFAQAGPEMQKAIIQGMTGFVGAGKDGEKLFRTSTQAFNYLQDPAFKASKFMDMVARDSSRIQDSMGTLAKLGRYNDYYIDFAHSVDIASKATTSSYEQQEKDAKDQQYRQKNSLDAATKAAIEREKAQRNSRDAMQNFVNKGVEPVTERMKDLANAVEYLTDLLPFSESAATKKKREGTNKTTGQRAASAAGGAVKGALGYGAAGAAAGGLVGGVPGAAAGGIAGAIYGGIAGAWQGAGEQNAPATPPTEGLRIKSAESTGGGAANPKLMELAWNLQKTLGSDLKYFSALNDRFHMDRNSKHNQGLALDLTLTDPSKAAQIANQIRGMPGVSNVIDEYANLSAGGTGGHIHAEVSARYGAQISGPDSGYNVNLRAHGDEMIVPLKDKGNLPIDLAPLSKGMKEQSMLLETQNELLGELLRAMKDTKDVNKKILQKSK